MDEARTQQTTGTARRRSPLLVAAAAVVALGLAGCGGDDGPAGGTATSLTPADARGADTTVKDAVRELAESVETCFKGSGDYALCTTNRQLGATTASLTPARPRAGEATITRATRTGYRILMVSLSGTRFALTRQGSSVIRSCAVKTPLGRSGGGCTGNGW
ncbi:hypothetical protein [Patulibacter minatonensis]|uniref:hypothetical protein n=1 Tax=Patulibacter minatonensis TaxID=298163 RepID=UPI00047CB3FE|nr:hypothetical protein [Patulibacter minatonensis]